MSGHVEGGSWWRLVCWCVCLCVLFAEIADSRGKKRGRDKNRGRTGLLIKGSWDTWDIRQAAMAPVAVDMVDLAVVSVCE